jgi:hypothetical protein
MVLGSIRLNRTPGLWRSPSIREARDATKPLAHDPNGDPQGLMASNLLTLEVQHGGILKESALTI